MLSKLWACKSNPNCAFKKLAHEIKKVEELEKKLKELTTESTLYECKGCGKEWAEKRDIVKCSVCGKEICGICGKCVRSYPVDFYPLQFHESKIFSKHSNYFGEATFNKTCGDLENFNEGNFHYEEIASKEDIAHPFCKDCYELRKEEYRKELPFEVEDGCSIFKEDKLYDYKVLKIIDKFNKSLGIITQDYLKIKQLKGYKNAHEKHKEQNEN